LVEVDVDQDQVPLAFEEEDCLVGIHEEEGDEFLVVGSLGEVEEVVVDSYLDFVVDVEGAVVQVFASCLHFVVVVEALGVVDYFVLEVVHFLVYLLQNSCEVVYDNELLLALTFHVLRNYHVVLPYCLLCKHKKRVLERYIKIDHSLR